MKSQHPDFYNGLFLDGTQLGPDWYDWYPARTFNVDCSQVSDTHDSRQYISNVWRQGVLNYLSSLRKGLPGIVIMCNDAIGYPDDFPNLSPLINGVESEGGIAYYLDHYPNANWQDAVLGCLQYWSQNDREPRVSLAISHYTSNPTTSCDQTTQAMLDEGEQAYQRMRFGLATSLLAGAYYLYEYNSYYCAQDQYWYDEYDNAGTQQPGYLGSPINRAYQIIDSSGAMTGIYRRDFQGGTALCNPTGASKAVDLGGTLFRIRGTQDPVTNNGQPTTQVMLDRLDGIILLNEPTP